MMGNNHINGDGPVSGPSLRFTPACAAYVHIPFCRAKCFYCDFNSYPGMEEQFMPYVEAIIREITSAEPGNSPLDTVYLGGGTPTVLASAALSRILAVLDDHLGLDDNPEVTIEANPGTVDEPTLLEIRQAGFNRLSIGVQSFDDAILSGIGRIHSSNDAREAFNMGRRAGFDNISIDLMYALPGQTISDWQRTLEAALSLNPEHISLYELTVEEGTVLGNLRNKCLIRLPDEDLQIDMYMLAINTLTSAGYEHYEVSNFALPGSRSRHNMTYWRNEPYYGFGAGASGYIAGIRYMNTKAPAAYIESLRSGKSVVETSETLSGRQEMGETVMLGLRMLDGMDLIAFTARFGISLEEAYPTELATLKEKGLIESTKSTLRLTPAGLLISNEVAVEFL